MEPIKKPAPATGLVAPYQTSDLYYAAYLKVASVRFIGIKRDEGGRDRVQFLFERGETDFDGLRAQYYNREAKVCALAHADEIKALKNLIHAR